MTGIKFIILINSPVKNDPCLFLKVTSQQKNKPATPGCIPKHGVFFIPQGQTRFKLNTWVQLYPIYEIAQKEIAKNKDISPKGKLDSKMTGDLIKCLLSSQEDDISQYHRDLIFPPLENALVKFQDLINKNRC